MAEPRHSPLEGMLPWAAPGGSVALAEMPFMRQVGVRRRGRASAYLAGLPLPLEANRVAAMGAVRVLWLGPDEWLVTAPEGDDAGLVQRLDRVEGAVVTDLSSSRAVIAISGGAARRLLERGCGIDLHPRAFGPGDCAQTLLAKVPVILDQVAPAPAYRVLVRRSLARWLAGWLIDAAGDLTPAGPGER
ncbi:MAG TPA: sarcosine oxidase subunit gamma family protein [Stellaceae bacterium]|jgi:sarcosine oxidase subunit gamma|nr:sarcosine oxidase subunit gamma family protein [Stellaceae bacterium]